MTTVTLPKAKYESINVPAFVEWTDRLEDGAIKQGKATLHEDNGSEVRMCCLGVASFAFKDVCDLTVDVVDVGYAIEHRYNGSGTFPVAAVLDHIGIPDSHREHMIHDQYTILVRINQEEADILNDHGAGFTVGVRAGELVGIHKLNDSGIPFQTISAILKREFLEA